MSNQLPTTKDELIDQAAERLAELLVMVIDGKTACKIKGSKLPADNRNVYGN